MTDKEELGIPLLRYEALLAQQRNNQVKPDNQAQPDNQVEPDYQVPPRCKAQADYPRPPCFITEQPSNQETPLLAYLWEDESQPDQQPVVIGVVGQPDQTVLPPKPGPHPFTAQPGYTQTFQHIQQTSTALMQQPATQAFFVQMPPRPSSWLGLSIFTFLCCGWLFGLIAMIFSCMVDSAYNRGDYEEARKKSDIAKWLNIAGIRSGVGITVYIIVYFIVG